MDSPAAKALKSGKTNKTNRFWISLRGPGNGCAPGPTSYVVNKPRQNITKPGIFNINNINRGGASELLALDATSLNSNYDFTQTLPVLDLDAIS